MVFITGASSGIGAACARAFAGEKRSLLLVARRLDLLETFARELREAFGVEVVVLPLDVSDSLAVKTFSENHKTLLSKVSVLVNNAGLAKGFDPIEEGKPEDWDVMIDTNIKGLLYVSRMVLPFFTEKKKGHIINLGSVAGHLVYPKGHVYCATKHAVHALNQAMRLDLNGSGVRVTEISPGMVETAFSVVRFGSQSKADAVYAGMKPLTAEDVAEAVAWSVNRPAHVNIQEIVLYPTDQASPTIVSRSTVVASEAKQSR